MSRLNVKQMMTVISAGMLCSAATAGFEQFNDPIGGMNVWQNGGGTNGSEGGYLFYSPWGVPDLQAITTDNRTFELAPNISAYAGAVATVSNTTEIAYWTNSDDGGVTPGPDGNKWMGASTLFEIPSISDETSATFSFTVDAFDIDPRYTVTGFIKVLDPFNGYSATRLDDVEIVSTGTQTLTITSLNQVQNQLLQAGWEVRGLNANPSNDWGSVTVTATILEADVGDTDPPSPDPMGFLVEPVAISDQAISMTASNATDTSLVEYYFECTLGGGNDSGWQASPVYVDSGLTPNTEYTYSVKARDLSVNNNETDPSGEFSATTLMIDTDAPSPNPMVFSEAPDVSPISVILTATNATDASFVEYYFTCTEGDGHDSGWQSSPVYIDTGLVPGSNYAYTVMARDLSIATNMTGASEMVSVVTPVSEKWMVDTLTNFTGNTTMGQTLHTIAKSGFETGSVNDDAVIAFGADGATFGEGLGYEARDILRTIGQDYDDSGFEVYATYIFDGVQDQAAFIGMGQGVITGVPGNWGVPELSLAGVSGVVGELKTTLSNGDKNCSMLRIDDGSITTKVSTDPIAINDTFRVRLAYDADTETATISVDTNYMGGAFVADQELGAFSTSNMWADVPVRVYVGGGEGTVVSDLIIRATGVVVDDLSIADGAGAGVVLIWEASAGQVYDVVRKDDLQFGPWESDTSPGCTNIFAASNGMISATSTVSQAQMYYQVIAK